MCDINPVIEGMMKFLIEFIQDWKHNFRAHQKFDKADEKKKTFIYPGSIYID